MAIKTYTAGKTHKQQVIARRRQAKIQNTLWVGGGLLILVAVVWLLFRSSPIQSVVPARVGAAIGEFSLTDIYGKTVHLSDYKGKTVMINAWATWCPPCKAEMPLLNSYYQSHVKDNFVLLAVNAGDAQNVTASFADQYGLEFPVLLDPGTRLLGQMAIDSFPTSIVIGKDGKVKTIHVGIFTPESIEAELSPLLKQ